MAHSDTSDNGTIRKLVILCISLTTALNVPTFFILTEHSNEIADIRRSLDIKTVDRYYRTDANAHEKMEDIKFAGVYFRFERNEATIAAHGEAIEELKNARRAGE